MMLTCKNGGKCVACMTESEKMDGILKCETVEECCGDLEEILEKCECAEKKVCVYLSCEAGDKVYVITSPYNVTKDEVDHGKCPELYEAYVESISLYKCGNQYRLKDVKSNEIITCFITDAQFGKDVFASKEKAEKVYEEVKAKFESQMEEA